MICPVVCPLFTNTQMSVSCDLFNVPSHEMSLSCYPFYIQSHRMSVWRYSESLHNCTVCSNIWTMSQNAVNPISKNIQSTVNLSRQCIQFTPLKAHSNTSTLYTYSLEYYILRHNSLPYSQRILSSSVVRCTVLIYMHGNFQRIIEPT